jgi:hypothetical protein
MGLSLMIDKISQFRKLAAECRKPANEVPPELAAHFDELAAIWDKGAEALITFFVPNADSKTIRQDRDETIH